MSQTLSVFISSKMQELAAERQAIRDLLPDLGGGVIDLAAWVYEADAPASDESIRQVYLQALQHSALYIGLFWNQYGEWTIDEFDRATEWGITRHLYVKNVDADQRDPRLSAFLEANSGVVTGVAPKWFTNLDELRDAVRESIAEWIQMRLIGRRGALSATLFTPGMHVVGAPERLIGRDDLLAAVTAEIARGERTLLHGFGGEGKTALAATLAQQRLDADQGPVLWLHAGQSSAEAVFEALAEPAKARQAVARATGDAQLAVMQQIITQMGARLVVLDDVWNGQALARVLQAMPPGMPVLITARTRYPIPQQHLIGGLDTDCARDLLDHYAGRAVSALPEADDLAADLTYHAYALEIAAKNMLADDLTPAQLRARIADAPHDLNMPEFFAAGGRESIAALLRVSLDALDDETRASFDAFGAFASPRLTPELLAFYLHGVPGKRLLKKLGLALVRFLIRSEESRAPEKVDIDAALSALVRRGLAEHLPEDANSAATLRLHDLAHSYARSEANDVMRGRGVDACLSYVTCYDTPSLDNFKALRPVLDALLGAAEVAADSGRNAEVERFAWGLWTGSELLSCGGHAAQAIPLLTQAAAAAARRGNCRDQGAHLSNLGTAYMALGQVERAIEVYQGALEIAREIGDRLNEGIGLVNLGNAVRSLGQVERAIEYYEQALVIMRKIGNRCGVGATLGNLGNAYQNLGQIERAIEYHEQALGIAREIGDRRNEGNWLGNLGNAYRNLGQIERAIEYHEQALVISREMGYRHGEEQDLGSLGNAYADLGQTERAIEYYEQALVIAREIGNRLGEGNTLGNLGYVYRNLGQVERAIEYHEQALGIAREIGDQRNEGNWLGNLGNAYQNLGQVERAIEYYEQALVIAREIGDRRNEGNWLGNLGNESAALGQVERAIEYHEQALVIAREIGNRRGEGNTLGNLGTVYGDLGQVERAIEYFEQALVIAREIGNRRGEGNDLGNLGTAYGDLGQVERAIEYHEQALVIAREIGDRRNEGNQLGNLGNAYADMGQVAHAIEFFEQARAILNEIGAANLVEEVDQNLAAARAQLSGDDDAE